MAERLGDDGLVVGLDISDEMVRHARAKGGQFRNLKFVCAPADHVPYQDDFFTKILSIEAFY